jgi:hypothetical protein
MYGACLSSTMEGVETGNPSVDAEVAFVRERRRRRRAAIGRRLFRGRERAGELQSLERALGSAPPAWRRSVGLREIAVDSIVGTAETAKATAFDGRFRPPSSSRRRWERLWIAWTRGTPMPPIAVFRINDHHYVEDGHHRVSVAIALGATAIDADVTELVPAGAS